LSAIALSGVPAGARAEETDEFCGCRLFLGVGGTYHYWAITGGIVAPFILDASEGRYELGVFRITTPQMLKPYRLEPPRRFASPYWGFSLSRRWRVLTHRSLRLYVGLGASYKGEEDHLNSTHWNFAEQLALQWRVSRALSVELAVRHWSNAGIRLPNRGQDFATLTVGADL
jgi:hypothetical protein